MYEAITCGTCGKCVRKWPHTDESPFEYVNVAFLRSLLKTRCGICAEWSDEPMLVMLDTLQEDMPCGGAEWTERE